jgi:hypothetical protein
MSDASNRTNASASADSGDDQVKPLFMYQYLQQLGDRQKEAMESFYDTAVEKPCQTIKCDDNTFGELSFGCSFLSINKTQDHHDADTPQDPFNRNIVGPSSCEYCNAKSTLECDTKTCDRPQLYFLKKRPPFENSREEWNLDGFPVKDMEYLKRAKVLKEKAVSGGLKNDATPVDMNKGRFIDFLRKSM